MQISYVRRRRNQKNGDTEKVFCALYITGISHYRIVRDII